MKEVITYNEAVQIWQKYITSPHLKLHMRETEVIMRKLANYFKADENLWAVAGLLHDLDLDLIATELHKHGYETVRILKDEGYNIPELFDAIIAHTEGLTDAKRTTDFQYILAAAENITGMISAYVLILPDKKINGIQPKSIIKRLKEKKFAANVNREFIYDIEKTGISLDNFIQLSIQAMTEIAPELNM